MFKKKRKKMSTSNIVFLRQGESSESDSIEEDLEGIDPIGNNFPNRFDQYTVSDEQLRFRTNHNHSTRRYQQNLNRRNLVADSFPQENSSSLNNGESPPTKTSLEKVKQGEFIVMGVRMSNESFYIFLVLGCLVILGIMIFMLATKQTILLRNTPTPMPPPIAEPTFSPTPQLVSLPSICDQRLFNETDLQWFNSRVRPNLLPSKNDFSCNQTQGSSSVRCNSGSDIVSIIVKETFVLDYPLAIMCLSRLECFSSETSGNGGPVQLRKEWVTMPFLQKLSLCDNNIQATIPPEFEQMSSTMQTLKINSTDLTGTIPTQIGNIGSLKNLTLQGNLDGALPTELGQLQNMVDLCITNSDIHGKIPRQLGELSWLQALKLDRNQLTGSIPIQLRKLSRLDTLHLHNNLLSGSIHNLDVLQVSRECRLYNNIGGEGNCFECPINAEDLLRKCSLESSFNLSKNCFPVPCT